MPACMLELGIPDQETLIRVSPGSVILYSGCDSEGRCSGHAWRYAATITLSAGAALTSHDVLPSTTQSQC